jgi:hypothetical protein
MRWKYFEESMTELFVTLASLALGWGLALLLSKGVSFAWPAAEPWVFYWAFGMWSLVVAVRLMREGMTDLVIALVLMVLHGFAAHG